jgi:MoaA/NifB/PqqE/SkfB family radical SAM enzyme/SAM-dependent methyltransferase
MLREQQAPGLATAGLRHLAVWKTAMASGDELYLEARDGYHLVVDPGGPHWLAANEDGAFTLRRLRAGASPDDISYRLAKRRGVSLRQAMGWVSRFADEAADFLAPDARPPYRGRAHYLHTDRLREVWLHVTDRCNLACRHCLVSSGPAGADGMPTEAVLAVIRQACELGADTFYFTGGEPFLRPDMVQVLRRVTRDHGATAVVLTNGLAVSRELVSALAQLPRERLFLQVSLDGSCARINDSLRAPGSFEGAVRGLRTAMAAGLNVTVATVVLRENLDDLVRIADLVRGLGVKQLHLMWQHVRERGAGFVRPDHETLIPAIVALASHAQGIGLVIDNLENARRVVNGDPHVKRDLSNACWDSLAIYRDGRVFPSACLVGVDSEAGGRLRRASLRDIWLGSDVFAARRAQSVIHAPGPDGDPFLFLHGGGDPEQAFFAADGNGGQPTDPYLPLHRALARYLIDEIVRPRRALIGEAAGPVIYHMMGEDGYGCPMEAGVRNGGEHKVDFVHSNCVLIQDVIAKVRAQIQRYYAEAAREPKAEICSPIMLDRRFLTHIPEEVIARSYGCGSPVFTADLSPGEVVVDLGSGAGLECFIASRLVGPAGQVLGVDMTDDMLASAEQARPAVARSLGYSNVSFLKGLLESLPLPDDRADAVISNCVINLSPEKLRVFAEIRRVLKPGGRVVISDIVSEHPLPAEIRFNPRLRGECIAGALTERKLLQTLEKLGFEGVEVVAKTPWRMVEEVPFHSVTVRAWKKGGRGNARPTAVPTRSLQDCMVCAAPLTYLEEPVELRCHYCGEATLANARCEQGHFVCDQCHAADHVTFIKSFCARTAETDPVALFFAMRRWHLFPVHGPEHHVLAPAAFLTAYRNRFGGLPQARIDAAVDRATSLPGGTCAYWGACSAALGIGIAYATILQATPLSRDARGTVQTVVSKLLAELGRFPAPRCCRRETYLALKLACDLSAEYLPHALEAGPPPACDQTKINRECLGTECPIHPGRA